VRGISGSTRSARPQSRYAAPAHRPRPSPDAEANHLNALEGRANTGPRVQRLVQLQTALQNGARRSPGGTGVIQRAIAEDVATMGLSETFAEILNTSDTATRLVSKADELGVRVSWGGNHPITQRSQGGGVLQVLIPRGYTARQAVSSLVFELSNAVRYTRLEAVGSKAVSGEIADEDEYAREKIKLELEGMLTSGRIGLEAHKGGIDTSSGYFLGDYLDYAKQSRENPFLTRSEFIASKADEVLDRPHGLGTHRQVYRGQFRAFANPGNQEARAGNDRLKRLADQTVTVAKLTSMDYAVDKLWRETDSGPDVEQWLAGQQEAARWAPVYRAFRQHRLRSTAQRLNAGDVDLEQELTAMGRDRASELFAWVERNDEGEYRNLSQVLGMYLGYYDESPSQLTWNIYA